MGNEYTVTKTLIREDDFSDGISPVKRWYELMPNAVVSGGITTTGSSLTGTITACVAYIEGIRVATDDTEKTFTASKDTYVDLDKDGDFQYSVVANGASEPSIATNAVRLMRVVTDASAITTVTDFRALNAGFGMGAPVGI